MEKYIIEDKVKLSTWTALFIYLFNIYVRSRK